MNKVGHIFIILMMLLTATSCGKKTEDTQKKKKSLKSLLEPASDSLKKELQNSIISNDLTLLNETLKKIKRIDFYFSNGETPLTFSIKNAENKITRRLLKANYNSNLRNMNAMTPLSLSIIYKKLSITKLILLSKDLNINQKSKETKTALEYSVEEKQQNAAIELVIAGADIKSKLTNGLTVLDASQSQSLDRLSQFLNEIIKLEPTSYTKKFILNLISNVNTNLLYYLLKNKRTNLDILKKYNFLNAVIDIKQSDKSMELLHKLLKFGVNINLSNLLEETALIHSIMNSKLDHFEVLMQAGPDVNAVGYSKLTAIHYATKKSYSYEVQILLEAGAEAKYTYEDQNGVQTEFDACNSIPNGIFNFYQRTDRIKINDLLGCDYLFF